MYYDSKNQIIISKLPKNSIGSDGEWYIDFDSVNDIALLANHNYYTIRNDNPKPSDQYTEKVSQRIVILDYPYADVQRVWELSPEFIKDE